MSKGEHMKIQIRKGKSGKWFWKITASNGKILAASETYSSFRRCFQTANRVSQKTGLPIETA
jgi:uncharacterized protein YegP (UPF0339 family)